MAGRKDEVDPVNRALEMLSAPAPYPSGTPEAGQDTWIELMELEGEVAVLLSVAQAGQLPRPGDITELRTKVRNLDPGLWADRRDQVVYALDALEAVRRG